jgi:putative transposase
MTEDRKQVGVDVRQWTRGKGNCYDNAAIDAFCNTIKAQMIWRHTWETCFKAETAMFQYINGFYSPHRRQSALGGKGPIAFERNVALTSSWGGMKA